MVWITYYGQVRWILRLMLFHFDLVPVECVPPWGSPRSEKKHLHWYGLTDGQYWIQAGADALFEYSEYARSKKGYTRYCDYQVALLHEDLLKKLPHILEPVPLSLAPYLSGESGRTWWQKFEAWHNTQPDARLDEDQYWEIYGDATEWLQCRMLDTLHLSTGAGILMWSHDETVQIEWDNTDCLLDDQPIWSAGRGLYQLAREDFRREIISFHTRLMDQMAARVEKVLAGALPAEIHVDLDALQREQVERSGSINEALNGPKVPTDWERVSRAISSVEQEIEESKS